MRNSTADTEPTHYTSDVVGAQLGMPGAGFHAYLTRDLLHPPMVADPDMWANGRRWWHGSVEHTLKVGELAELRPGERLLDIGGGIGGPARLLAEQHDVAVTSVTNSAAHAATYQQLNRSAALWGGGTAQVMLADCQSQLPEGPFDAAISINMLYQVPDHSAVFTGVFASLRQGGRFVVDDWMLTPLADQDDVDRLVRHFQHAHFARTDRIEAELMAAGFPPAETTADLGHVGRELMNEHFERQMRAHFAPRVLTDWPGDPVRLPGRQAYGQLMLDEFVEAVKLTITLYRQRRLTYRRLLVRKSD